MNKSLSVLILVSIMFFCGDLIAQEKMLLSQSAIGAKAYIIEPEDGETVAKTFIVKFGLVGMGVAPAGVDKPNTGHHHLLIDSLELPQPGIPMGGNVMHFGGGQTEVEITLAEGKHTLQLVLGDRFHIPHNPMVVSEKVVITVE